MRERYAEQVRLIIDALPAIAAETGLALKGGTAINLFHRDMPRLSVDIDLTFLPIRTYDASLDDIDAALNRIVRVLDTRGVRAERIAGGGDARTRALLGRGRATVKLEVSPVNRGTVFPPVLRRVVPRVEDEFGFAEAQVVSFADLYGGKLHAALDRQHPRDLFDIERLYDNEGLTEEIFRAFLVCVAMSPRPPHELLDPHPKPLDVEFAREFEGMPENATTLDDLRAVRHRLIEDVRSRLVGEAAHFLGSLVRGTPDFDAIGLPDAALLPGVRWKIRNLALLRERNPKKQDLQIRALEALLR